MQKRILSWLRQTTTVQGLAVLACTAALQLTAAAPWQGVLAGTVASLVLLALPGQGDLSRKIGQIATDVAVVAATRGSAAAVNKLAADGLALAGADVVGADLPAVLTEARMQRGPAASN